MTVKPQCISPQHTAQVGARVRGGGVYACMRLRMRGGAPSDCSWLTCGAAQEALTIMMRGHFRHVPIVAPGADGAPCRIIGLLDVVQLLQGALAVECAAEVCVCTYAHACV
jgi:hypothetical protein